MATATMGVSSVDRMARSKRPTVERAEIHIPPAPTFPLEAVTGDPARRAQAVARFNNDLQKWRNDAWSIEAPFVPDAELQADVATLEDTTAKMSTKLDRAAIDIRLTQENVTTIETSITNIDNSITTINNQITVIEGNAITGTGIVQANGSNPPTAILGTPGHVPYWTSVGPPYISLTSPIYTDGTMVGIGTDLPAGALLDIGLAGTTAGTVRLAGSTSGNVTIQTAAAAGTWTLTLPVNDGAANEFLKTDGTGVASWSSVVLTTDVTGILPVANGGTNASSWTAGSVIFAGAGGTSLAQDNANLFWDDATNRLGVGTNAPNALLDVRGAAIFNENGIDADFRIESDTNANHFIVDAGLFAGVGGFSFGAVPNGQAYIRVDNPTMTSAGGANIFSKLLFNAGNAVTIPNGSSGVHSSVHLREPVLTKAGSFTGIATTLYIESAPTEGATNASLYVQAGDVFLGAISGNVGIRTGTTAPGALLDLGLAGTTLGVMRMAGSTSGNVTIQPAVVAGTWTLTLPVNDGAANEFLQTDGAGITSWSSVDLTTDVTGVLPIANGGTNANAFAASAGVVYFDGTSLVNSADLLYTPSTLTSRGTSLNGINAPYIAANLNIGANAGSEYQAVLADTSNNQVIAGYISWFKEQSWTTTAATQDSSATIGTTLDGATVAALLLRSSGSVICGKDATGTTRVDDFLYIPSSAGNPTGVAEEYGSRCPLVYDTTNNELFCYNVTDNTWRSAVFT